MNDEQQCMRARTGGAIKLRFGGVGAPATAQIVIGPGAIRGLNCKCAQCEPREGANGTTIEE